MKRFIPREKLAKKARKQLDSEQRATWAFAPVTKKIESKKLYNRKRKSHDRYDDYGMGFLFYDDISYFNFAFSVMISSESLTICILL